MNNDPLYDDTISARGTGPTVSATVDVDVAAESFAQEERRNRSTWPGEQVFLAGLGAAATALDTAGQCFDQLVQRGEQVQNDWEDRADDIRRQNAGARLRARNYFRGAMDMFLDTFNVPSRTDIDTVNVKLNILTRKIDDLQMQTVPEPVPPTSSGPTAATSDPLPPVTGDLAT